MKRERFDPPREPAEREPERPRWPMKLGDPQRPKNGLGQLMMRDGNLVPSFNLRFLDGKAGSVRIEAYLQGPEGGFKYRLYSTTFKTKDLAEWFMDFEDDPEKALLDWFDYDVRDR